jgi:2-hydroxy-3-keto-5-methylthiopentenyl-1-phosphate phosphatase
MLAVGAVLVDFDGTACTVDVAEQMLSRFVGDGWQAYDEAVDRADIGLREAISAQNAMLTVGREELIGFAVRECPLEPSFGPFVRWLAGEGVPVAIVSDGFGFYIEPILEAAGVHGLTIITNEQLFYPDGRPEGMSFVSGNPDCIGCGTCKMLAVQRYRSSYGPVAFIGEGQTDRYGALYADVVFAKDALIEHCERDGVRFIRWETFDDVRGALEEMRSPAGPVAPAVCPGWTPA